MSLSAWCACACRLRSPPRHAWLPLRPLKLRKRSRRKVLGWWDCPGGGGRTVRGAVPWSRTCAGQHPPCPPPSPLCGGALSAGQSLVPTACGSLHYCGQVADTQQLGVGVIEQLGTQREVLHGAVGRQAEMTTLLARSCVRASSPPPRKNSRLHRTHSRRRCPSAAARKGPIARQHSTHAGYRCAGSPLRREAALKRAQAAAACASPTSIPPPPEPHAVLNTGACPVVTPFAPAREPCPPLVIIAQVAPPPHDAPPRQLDQGHPPLHRLCAAADHCTHRMAQGESPSLPWRRSCPALLAACAWNSGSACQAVLPPSPRLRPRHSSVPFMVWGTL